MDKEEKPEYFQCLKLLEYLAEIGLIQRNPDIPSDIFVYCEGNGKEYPEGDFVLKDGTPLGKHRGIIRYTRGQRRGLGIAYSEPLYVLRVDAAENRVVLGSNSDLFSKNLTAGDFIWTCGVVPEKPINCKAKIRYKHKEQPCTASVLPNGDVSVVFDEPQRAITPGQACVLYRDDEVLGGGTILPDQNREC